MDKRGGSSRVASMDRRRRRRGRRGDTIITGRQGGVKAPMERECRGRRRGQHPPWGGKDPRRRAATAGWAGPGDGGSERGRSHAGYPATADFSRQLEHFLSRRPLSPSNGGIAPVRWGSSPGVFRGPKVRVAVSSRVGGQMCPSVNFCCFSDLRIFLWGSTVV